MPTEPMKSRCRTVGSTSWFSYIGYENEQLPLILRKGDTKTKDVYMNIKTNLLGDVVVSADASNRN